MWKGLSPVRTMTSGKGQSQPVILLQEGYWGTKHPNSIFHPPFNLLLVFSIGQTQVEEREQGSCSCPYRFPYWGSKDPRKSRSGRLREKCPAQRLLTVKKSLRLLTLVHRN